MISGTNRKLIDKAMWLITTTLGKESIYESEIVSDIGVGYAEPGYEEEPGSSVIVFGNWNPPRFPRSGELPLTKEESIAPRLADALEAIGVSLEWADEWTICSDCARALRTVADSYHWQMYGQIGPYGDVVCADCLREDLDSALAPHIDHPDSCVTWLEAADLEAAGWTCHSGDYQSGWHAGMRDEPEQVYDRIKLDSPDKEVVFLLDESTQFYCRFSAWTRRPVEDRDEIE